MREQSRTVRSDIGRDSEEQRSPEAVESESTTVDVNAASELFG